MKMFSFVTKPSGIKAKPLTNRSAKEQSKLFRDAAEKSTKRQTQVIEKYEASRQFGERIEH